MGGPENYAPTAMVKKKVKVQRTTRKVFAGELQRRGGIRREEYG
jgi:hypothetical protein